ncbi:hypothetical protein [Microbulbifer hydrolyticus]|uniref:Uncharacterized protein n=1 Tax=Microbulbifer hydrolyticus TaxID=48074 RepID=A0A6P1T9A8_9GAMM|nr:hypothetical protein [Microbulbifer hydrolyticus]MBB5213182.1 hypothetical protein [Microbulbifer hydrolyticus]QHQ38617.1 hypothetical protein GTQ55_06185 [Microbulbifer hydrolyticus]
MSDESIYLEATEEFEGPNRCPALWAKALALCDGEHDRAKFQYVRLKVEKLSDSAVEKGNEPIRPDSADLNEYNSEETSQKDVYQSDPVNRLWISEKGEKYTYAKIFDGEIGLAKIYWVYGVLVGFAASIIISSLNSTREMAALLFIYAIYETLVLVGTWRSASHYGGPKLWAILAKLSVFVRWCGVLFAAITLFKLWSA